VLSNLKEVFRVQELHQMEIHFLKLPMAVISLLENEFPMGGEQYNKFDAMLTKLNVDGSVSWSTSFGESRVSHDLGVDAKQTSDGGYIISGYTKFDNNSDNYVWLIKTDADGKLVWENYSRVLSNGVSVVEAYDGGYVVTGPAGSEGDSSALNVIKTDANGRFLGDPIGVLPKRDYHRYSLTQHNKMLTISMPSISRDSKASVGIFNARGELLSTQTFRSGRVLWDFSTTPAKVALLKFQVDGKSFSDKIHLIK
jgi:hypothetical protein